MKVRESGVFGEIRGHRLFCMIIVPLFLYTGGNFYIQNERECDILLLSDFRLSESQKGDIRLCGEYTTERVCS